MFLEAEADAEHRDASGRDVFERARMPDYHRPSSGLLPNSRFFSGQTATRTATRLEPELMSVLVEARLRIDAAAVPVKNDASSCETSHETS